VAPPEIISKLVQLKQAIDLHTPTFNQYVAYEVARDGFLDEHVRYIRQLYRERRDAMLHALKDFFPPEVSWTKPQGGLFLWISLPKGLDSQKILDTAVAENVAFVPGQCFYAHNGEEAGRHMRLNFSNSTPDQIREGIRRLAVAVESALLVSYA
jgi:2-aminoadipate transaminase